MTRRRQPCPVLRHPSLLLLLLLHWREATAGGFVRQWLLLGRQRSGQGRAAAAAAAAPSLSRRPPLPLPPCLQTARRAQRGGQPQCRHGVSDQRCRHRRMVQQLQLLTAPPLSPRLAAQTLRSSQKPPTRGRSLACLLSAGLRFPPLLPLQ
jgi:hypothetical protein